MLLVLGGFLFLGAAAIIGNMREIAEVSPLPCKDQMMVTVIFSKNAENPVFEFRDSAGYHYQPFLESNKSIISKTGPARICYTKVEKNPEGLGRIYVNNIEYLPLPDEGK
jgi:hypothetical protein